MKRVVVGFITRNSTQGAECLLVAARRDFGQYTGHYYPPGGHVEAEESDEVALGREIREELGVEITGLRFLEETPGDVPDQITAWYACSLQNPQTALLVDEELSDVRFVTGVEAQALPLWPATRKFLEKHFF